MPKNIDIHDFAHRVERLCEFLLDKVEKDGSSDVTIVQDLHNDAADIQAGLVKGDVLSGLDNHMRGIQKE